MGARCANSSTDKQGRDSLARINMNDAGKGATLFHANVLSARNLRSIITNRDKAIMVKGTLVTFADAI